MREHRGGYYKMDHKSFGQMMVSEQLRKPLAAVSNLIKIHAAANTLQSGYKSTSKRRRGVPPPGSRLHENYEVEVGPIVILVVQGKASPRISQRVVNRKRSAARREFGPQGENHTGGTRDLRRAGERYGDLAGEPG